jgi:serine/threonine protein kinase
MEMCRRVAHPNLAWTYEVGVSQGCYYIALEYIPGKTLFRLVNEEGPLATPRAARLFAEVASALDHAHNQGLIHRDLKPSNIIITPHDHAKVLDLGLALVEGEAPTDREVQGGPGYVVGTMDYIAPEQTEDPRKVDPRSDIYALGCTLYFCLTGQAPFSGGTAQEKIHRHRHEEPLPVPQFNPSVPPAFIGLLRKMMAKNPDHRLASGAELQARLEEWAEPQAPLPLDQQEDPEYREAVTALEQAEAPPELVAEVIPVGIPVDYKPVKKKPARPASQDATSPQAMPIPRKGSNSWLWAVLGALAALAVLLGTAAAWRFLH